MKNEKLDYLISYVEEMIDDEWPMKYEELAIYNEIAKDLEILDILKKYLSIKEESNIFGKIELTIYKNNSTMEFNKIKEWLD